MHGIANDLSWAEQKSAVALVNYVPHASHEAARIAGLEAHHLVSWPDSSSEEDNEQEDEEQEGDENEEAEGQGEASPKLPSSGAVLKQGEMEQEAE